MGKWTKSGSALGWPRTGCPGLSDGCPSGTLEHEQESRLLPTSVAQPGNSFPGDHGRITKSSSLPSSTPRLAHQGATALIVIVVGLDDHARVRGLRGAGQNSRAAGDVQQRVVRLLLPAAGERLVLRDVEMDFLVVL